MHVKNLNKNDDDADDDNDDDADDDDDDDDDDDHDSDDHDIDDGDNDDDDAAADDDDVDDHDRGSDDGGDEADDDDDAEALCSQAVDLRGHAYTTPYRLPCSSDRALQYRDRGVALAYLPTCQSDEKGSLAKKACTRKSSRLRATIAKSL